MGDRVLVECPLCKKNDQRVILRLHWSNKYHEFICGHCRTEFSFIMDSRIPIELKLKVELDKYLVKWTGETMEQTIDRIMDTMTEEEMVERLDELNATYN